MNRPQTRVAAVGVLGFVAMALYVPYRDVERVYKVIPVQQPGGRIVSMGRTDELRAVNVLAAGYYWVWAPPQSDQAAWFGTERATSVNWRRLLVQAVIWALVVLSGMLLLRAPTVQQGGSDAVGPTAESGA